MSEAGYDGKFLSALSFLGQTKMFFLAFMQKQFFRDAFIGLTLERNLSCRINLVQNTANVVFLLTFSNCIFRINISALLLLKINGNGCKIFMARSVKHIDRESWLESKTLNCYKQNYHDTSPNVATVTDTNDHCKNPDRTWPREISCRKHHLNWAHI